MILHIFTFGLFFATTVSQTTKLGGVNFVAEGFEGPLSYDSPLSLQSLTDAKTIGINHIVYSFPWYVDSINSTMLPYRVDGGCPTGVPLNNASSPTDDSVVTAIRATKALGMSVVLRPMSFQPTNTSTLYSSIFLSYTFLVYC